MLISQKSFFLKFAWIYWSQSGQIITTSHVFSPQMVVFCFGKFGHVSIQMVLFQESKVDLSARWFGRFKNTSGDEVFLLDSLLIERHRRLRGRDAGCFRSHGHNHGLWKHGKSRRSKGFLEQILISCKSLRSVAVGFCGYTNHNAFSQNHHLQVNKSRQFF